MRMPPICCSTLPLPLHSGHVCSLTAGPSPVPWHVGQTSCRLMVILRVVPRIASQKPTVIEYSRSLPGRGWRARVRPPLKRFENMSRKPPPLLRVCDPAPPKSKLKSKGTSCPPPCCCHCRGSYPPKPPPPCPARAYASACAGSMLSE